MSFIIGSKKQEEKITKMGTIAHELFDKTDVIVFKGIFRYGVSSAMTEQGYTKWNDVAIQQRESRERFFESVLNHSIKRLKETGIDEKQIELLFHRLRKENLSYLS